ncbi:MAG: hypothetical protein ACO1PB_21645 [Ramlibacter sp.]
MTLQISTSSDILSIPEQRRIEAQIKRSPKKMTAMAANPFALMVDPAQVRQHIDRSEQLGKLSQRQCHPLDRAVIRCASAEIAAFDAKIDRTTIYLPPEEEKSQPVTRTYTRRVN